MYFMQLFVEREQRKNKTESAMREQRETVRLKAVALSKTMRSKAEQGVAAKGE